MKTGYIIDLIIAAIILLSVFISARRGFVRIVVETVGFLLALFITFTIHTPLADMTYDKMIAPAIEKAITDTAEGTTEEITSGVWDKIPSFVKGNTLFPGVTQEALAKTVENSVSAGKNTADSVSETLIRPTAVRILALIYSVVLMAVFMILVRIIASLLNKVFSFHLAGKINRILGGVVGIVRGLISAVIFCLVISLLVSFTKDGFWIFTPKALDQSVFMTLLSELHIVR